MCLGRGVKFVCNLAILQRSFNNIIPIRILKNPQKVMIVHDLLDNNSSIFLFREF